VENAVSFGEETPIESVSSVFGGNITAMQTGSGPDFSPRLAGSDVDMVNSVDIDSEGYIYATGSTVSPDFPVHDGLDNSFNGGSDCFVAKLFPDGNNLVYSTFIGGTGSDEGTSIFVDDNGSDMWQVIQIRLISQSPVHSVILQVEEWTYLYADSILLVHLFSTPHTLVKAVMIFLLILMLIASARYGWHV
jgi:hypothetical protein